MSQPTRPDIEGIRILVDEALALEARRERLSDQLSDLPPNMDDYTPSDWEVENEYERVSDELPIVWQALGPYAPELLGYVHALEATLADIFEIAADDPRRLTAAYPAVRITKLIFDLLGEKQLQQLVDARKNQNASE